MRDALMPSFHSNPFSSTSAHFLWEWVRDLSTLNLAYINGRISHCQHFHGNTSMSCDWQILIDARRQKIYWHSSYCTMYLDAHHHYWWVIPHWLMVFNIDQYSNGFSCIRRQHLYSQQEESYISTGSVEDLGHMWHYSFCYSLSCDCTISAMVPFGDTFCTET